MVNELVSQAVDSTEATLKGNDIEHIGFSADNHADGFRAGQDLVELAAIEIEEGVHKLESLLNSTVDRSLDIMEVFVARNFLSITNVPGEEDLESWVRLDHYEGIDTSVDSDTRMVDSDGLLLLRRKAQETEKLNVLLKAEAVRNDAILEQLKALSGASQTSESTLSPNLGFLMQSHDKTTQLGGRLARHMEYLLPRIDSIKTSLAHLRPYLSALPELPVTEAAITREAYLQDRSATAMAKAGVSAADGALANPLAGRQMNENEVQALEAVAAELHDEP